MAQMPMPAQGAPVDESATEQAHDAAEQGQKSGGASELIVGVDAGLSKLVAMLDQAQGVDPKIKESIGNALQMYRQGVESLLASDPNQKGMPEQGPMKKPMPSQSASPEAGGNPNAVPM